MTNPLKNGQIISKGTSNGYVGQAVKRGDRAFVMSRSELMGFVLCPHKWLDKEEEPDTAATTWGSLVDCLRFEPGNFGARFAIYPETYPSTAEPTKKNPNPETIQKSWNNNATYCREWVESQADKICIHRGTYDSAMLARHRLNTDSIASAILKDADYQVHIRAEYHDPETGLIIPVKALLDIVPKGNFADELDDFKTARDGNPAKWARVVYANGYHVQSALHLDAYNAATGENRQVFGHVVQESDAPYEVSTPQLTVEMLNLGRSAYKSALELYARCLATNHWPSYNELSNDQYKGRPLIHPESWMMAEAPISDPDWLRDPQPNKEAA